MPIYLEDLPLTLCFLPHGATVGSKRQCVLPERLFSCRVDAFQLWADEVPWEEGYDTIPGRLLGHQADRDTANGKCSSVTSCLVLLLARYYPGHVYLASS